MAQTVPLNWYGSFAAYAGPLASGQTDHWIGNGDWGRENRFFLFTACCEGVIAAELEIVDLSHYRTQEGASFKDETHFGVRNNGSGAPVYYFIYIAWTSPINV
jgi:hypothetical protein